MRQIPMHLYFLPEGFKVRYVNTEEEAGIYAVPINGFGRIRKWNGVQFALQETKEPE